MPSVNKEKLILFRRKDKGGLAVMRNILTFGTMKTDETTSKQDSTPDNIDALLALADRLGIPHECTLAVGDSDNDRAMLEKAGVAAVMANGMEHIRKLADIVSENDNDHDGVAEIFARLGL